MSVNESIKERAMAIVSIIVPVLSIFVVIVFLLGATGFAQEDIPDKTGTRFIDRFDKDEDGRVSKDEFSGPDKIFTRHDENGDGFIDESEKPGRFRHRKHRGENFIQHLDKDGDKRISRDEFSGPEKMFDRHDEDGDGYISKAEVPKGPGHFRRRSGNLIKHFDEDNDGQVSKDEFPGPDKIFSRLDENKDGFINESEVPVGHGHGRKCGRRFMHHLDEDEDGKVSKDEFPGPDKIFSKLDEDEDGFIDESEAPVGRRHGRKWGGNFMHHLHEDGDDKAPGGIHWTGRDVWQAR